MSAQGAKPSTSTPLSSRAATSARPNRAASDEDIAVAVVLADLETIFEVSICKLPEQEQLSGQQRGALGSRVVIERAEGIQRPAQHGPG